jgi:hypothetical protein
VFSFRYHAISLVAVFLALGIGILVGVSIGEKGVVSSAQRDLEKSLRGDLDSARSNNAELRSELAIRNDFEGQAYPALVANLLPGYRIGIVAIGDLPSGFSSAIRDAVEPAGAKLASISVIRAPLPLDRVATDLRRTSFAHVDSDARALARFGERFGRQIANGGGLIDRVRRSLLSSSRGDYRGLDGIVWVRDRGGLTGDDKTAEDQLEAAVVRGMRSGAAQVVGVEMRSTDPSQIPFMSQHGLTSVDDIDLIAGRAALIYALLGADGQFGVKSTAGQILPPPPIPGTARR